jgi:hypothetical protein
MKSTSRNQEKPTPTPASPVGAAAGLPAPDSPESLAINILLDEYRTLRAESLQSIQARHQIIAFAFGAMSVVIAGLVTSNASMIMLGAIAYLAVPQIAKSSLMMWLGEYRRSARAGEKIREVETKINALARCCLLSWENSLSATKIHMSYPYTATVVIILGVSYASTVIGISYITAFALSNPKMDLGIDIFVKTFSKPCILVELCGGLTLFALAFEICFWKYFAHHWRIARAPSEALPPPAPDHADNNSDEA